jgi:phosphoribosylglycinamide formyltransferase 1
MTGKLRKSEPMAAEQLKIGFMASHGGSSMKGILAAIADGSLAATPCVAICNNADAPALAIARQYGVPHHHLSQSKVGPEVDLDETILDTLRKAGTEIVVLSGYLRKLGPKTLKHFRRRVLNIHPSLLPKYGGRGMYGTHVHAAVIAAAEPTSGVSVHLVEADYDTGPVVLQRPVAVQIGDTPETLGERIAAIEAELFVETLRVISSGHINLDALLAAH